MWVHGVTVGMRPSFTSYWAYANKSQIIPFCGVRRICPADVCPAQNSPVADFCLSVSVHSNTPPSNSIQALSNAILLIYIDEQFPLFIPSKDKILIQKTASFFACRWFMVIVFDTA